MNVSVRHWVLLLHLLIAISMSSLFNLRRLSQEARSAQAASDQAFDKGDLKQSLNEAEYASLVSISDSQSSKQSIDRIEAIAMGSEATGRPRTALLAWSSLSATFLATRSVASSNSRLGQQPEQHMTYLLSKVTNRPATEAVRSEPLTSSALRMANHWSGSRVATRSDWLSLEDWTQKRQNRSPDWPRIVSCSCLVLVYRMDCHVRLDK